MTGIGPGLPGNTRKFKDPHAKFMTDMMVRNAEKAKRGIVKKSLIQKIIERIKK